MKFFLIVLVAVSFQNVIADTTKFPNLDSLSYWNRAMEWRDELLRTRKDLGEAQMDFETKLALYEMRKNLFEKKAISEEEYREYLWAKEAAELRVEQTRKKILSEEIYEQIQMLRYEEAKTGKPEILITLATYQAEQWKNRIEMARLAMQEAESEIRFRDFQWNAAEKLIKSGAITKHDHLLVTERRNNAQQNLLLANQRLALAELAHKEAADAAATMKPVPPSTPTPAPPTPRR